MSMNHVAPTEVAPAERATLVAGVNHIATVTHDLPRLIAFYQRVFDVDVPFDLEEDGVHHAMIRLAGEQFLHVFAIPWIDLDGPGEMFARGRIDHFGLTVPSVEALLEVRRRLQLEGEGVTDGLVRDFGPLYSLSFVDPDGVELEVNVMKPSWGNERVLPPAEWTVVDLGSAPVAASMA